jgi:hypothetical protein
VDPSLLLRGTLSWAHLGASVGTSPAASSAESLRLITESGGLLHRVKLVLAHLSEPFGLTATDRIAAIDRALNPVPHDHPSAAKPLAARSAGFQLPVKNPPSLHDRNYVNCPPVRQAGAGVSQGQFGLAATRTGSLP